MDSEEIYIKLKELFKEVDDASESVLNLDTNETHTVNGLSNFNNRDDDSFIPEVISINKIPLNVVSIFYNSTDEEITIYGVNFNNKMRYKTGTFVLDYTFSLKFKDIISIDNNHDTLGLKDSPTTLDIETDVDDEEFKVTGKSKDDYDVAQILMNLLNDIIDTSEPDNAIDRSDIAYNSAYDIKELLNGLHYNHKVDEKITDDLSTGIVLLKDIIDNWNDNKNDIFYRLLSQNFHTNSHDLQLKLKKMLHQLGYGIYYDEHEEAFTIIGKTLEELGE